ncbi:MAG: signal peptidase I, partial [Patescibacteria group bacterium]|nr:signal peptidase I [Patescibacteria group bacterium]
MNIRNIFGILSYTISVLVFSITFVAFALTYSRVIAEKLNLTTDTVYLSGTGSMYPTFPKGEGKTYSELRKQIVDAPQMNRYPSGFEIFGKKFFSYELKRGDIVSFKNAKTIEITQKEGGPIGFVKRIIALPGDKIEIRDGNVYINGEVLLEPYIARARSTFGDITLKECVPLTIPEG